VFLNSKTLITDNSEFILPLDEKTESEYLALWKTVRNS
jgi:hypothetical protein